MVNRWYEAFTKGIPALNWKIFGEKFLPAALKMAGLSHAQVTRYAASQIIIAATNFAVSNKIVAENLMEAYLELCQDIDMSIRTKTLKNLSFLLKLLNRTVLSEDFLPEVLCSLHYK